jgi:phosphomannomutase
VREELDMAIPKELRDRVFAWVADDPELETAQEALGLIAAEDEAALRDRFDSRLEFGTAGLRGLLGSGPNRMNRAVVRKTTAGLCSYLFKNVPHAHAQGIVIGRDGRAGSDTFATEAARVAMGMGFVVHYFNELASTPALAFAVQDLGAAAGVMVTASHNPAEYNGYKVYWNNAAQIIPPHDTGIAAAIDGIQSAKGLSLLDAEAGKTLGLFRTVSRDVLNHYYASLAALRFDKPADLSLAIAYTPMHGVGAPYAKRAFAEGGFKNVFIVAEQEKPDAAFPTVRFPNPEEKGAMDLVLALAEKHQADLVLANDPDADRLAVAYRTKAGKYVTLTGNQIGVLLGHHRLVDDPKLQANRLVMASLVSSPQLGAIAKELGVRYEETLTGFKWIANGALALEASSQAKFIFGFEEALGYTVSTIVRDKDGVSAALVCAQLAAILKAKGQTIGDRLDEISQQFGVYSSEQVSATIPGLSGAAIIKGIMAHLREKTPWTIGDAKVVSLRDYDKGQVLTAGGAPTKLNSPPSNVLAFDLEDDARIIARPSGTEPKIKYYFDVRTKLAPGETLEQGRARGAKRVAELKQAFLAIVGAASK